MILITLAVLFLIGLFFLKTKSEYKANLEASAGLNGGIIQDDSSGLVYRSELLGNLVNKDTDSDGILDWEENLWGTDPTKKETTPGIKDKEAIEKIKREQQLEKGAQGEGLNLSPKDEEDLTQTDKFSRELFSTVSALSQSGPLDQTTIDELGSSLAEKVRNSPPEKVFLLSDLKIIKDDSKQAIKSYADTLNNIYKKHPINKTVIDVLQDFVIDEENVDATALSELDPIIKQTKGILDDLIKMNIPPSLATLHLDVINALQRLLENINNIQLFDTDVIVAFSAINQYGENTDSLEEAAKKLTNALDQKLNN